MPSRRKHIECKDEEEESRLSSRCMKCLVFIWKVFTCLFSHVTLMTMVVCYCIAGAFMFESLEKNNEILVKKNVSTTRNYATKDLFAFTKAMIVIRQDNFTSGARLSLRTFENNLVLAIRKNGWDGSEDTEVLQWTFLGSLFYTIIVVTTIGYGHIAPKTSLGKVATIFYAIVGIPLMLMCLSNVGDLMARSFRFIYWEICCFSCSKKSKKSSYKKRHQRAAHIDGFSHSNRDIEAKLDKRQGNERFEHSMTLPRRNAPDERDRLPRPRSCPIDDFGDGQELSGIICNKYALDDDHPQVYDRQEPSRISRFEKRSVRTKSHSTKSKESANSADSDEVPVPIWLCVFLVISYIIGGAFLFSDWEDWNFADSAYFCFITLTTIGFGDFVPAQRVNNKKNGEISIALCSIYLLFGISLLAMSFNLVQEEVVNNAKTLARHLGIIKDQEADEYEDDEY